MKDEQAHEEGKGGPLDVLQCGLGGDAGDGDQQPGAESGHDGGRVAEDRTQDERGQDDAEHRE